MLGTAASRRRPNSNPNVRSDPRRGCGSLCASPPRTAPRLPEGQARGIRLPGLHVLRPGSRLAAVDAAGLAALAGREPQAILRAFPELGRAALRQGETGRRYTRKDIQHAYAAKLERYAAIRRDFDGGMSERTIERRHHVGRRTIVMALDSPEPPARKRIHREPTALRGLHDHIDAMLEADAGIGTAAIWQRLADDHGATVAYYTLRTYVVSRRAAKPPDKND